MVVQRLWLKFIGEEPKSARPLSRIKAMYLHAVKYNVEVGFERKNRILVEHSTKKTDP
jgi:hypothetical protein